MDQTESYICALPDIADPEHISRQLYHAVQGFTLDAIERTASRNGVSPAVIEKSIYAMGFRALSDYIQAVALIYLHQPQIFIEYLPPKDARIRRLKFRVRQESGQFCIVCNLLSRQRSL